MTPERSAAGRRTAPALRYRDAEPWDDGATHDVREGKRYVAAIGIDQYRSWRALTNAVSDACGALRTFEKLGFEPIREPILDDAATGDALRRLVIDDLRTARQFARNVQVPIHDGGPALDVDLVAEAARLVIVIDGWYRGDGPQAYRRDHGEDTRLQRAGYFVMRFAAEDIGARLALVVHEIAIGLGGRRASGASRGEPSW